VLATAVRLPTACHQDVGSLSQLLLQLSDGRRKPNCCSLPVTLLFFFGPLLLLFAVLACLSLLPATKNKTSKNPEDYIIKRAKTK